MRLTIDTKHDSHDEIKHAIQILNDLLERKGIPTTTQEASPEATTNMMNMFSDTPTEEETLQKEIPDTAPDFSSFLNLTNKQEEKKEEAPKVQFF